MKNVNICLLLACGIALSSTTNSVNSYGNAISALVMLAFPTLFKGDADFTSAFLIGLQNTPDVINIECITSYEYLVSQINSLHGFSEEYTQTIPNNAFDKNWGVYAKYGKRYMEIAGIFYTFYEDCYLDDLLITIGRTINSWSGLLSTYIHLVFIIYYNIIL